MTRRIAAVLAGTLLLALVPAAALAQDDDGAALRGHPLVGAWVVTGEGQPVELITFHDDGTIRSASVVGFSVGAWAPTGRRTANATLLSPFELDDVGFIGLGTIRGSVQVSRDGDTFTGTYTIEFPTPLSESMDPLPAGQLGPVEVTGERIDVEAAGEPAGPLPTTDGGAGASPAPDAAASPAAPADSPAAASPGPAASPVAGASPLVDPSPIATVPDVSPLASPLLGASPSPAA